MRTRLMRGKISLLFLTCALLIAVPAVAALADDIANNLDTSVDADYETLALNAGGSNGSVTLRVVERNGDGKNGCNFQGSSESFTASVSSSNTSVATVSPSSVTFGSCGDTRTLTVTPGSAGSANITLSQTSNTTGESISVAPASFTVTVSASNSAPNVSVTGPVHGATYEFGTVPTPGCSVTDAEDTNEAATPQVSAISGTNAAYGLGTQTVTCSYTDGGNLTETDEATYEIVDTTKPNIAAHGDVSAEATGPNGAEVTYTAPTANDAVYGSVDVECTPASGTTFALGTTEVTCTATDGSGNEAVPTTFNVKVQDTTAPVIASHDPVTEEATGPDGANVTYTSPGTTDAVDGNGTANCTPASGSKFALGDTTVTCTATDAAGNEATSTTFKVTVEDTTPPELNLPANITEEATGPNGNVVTYNATSSDLVDGSVNVECTPASGSTFPIATTTVDCSATDTAGNKSTGSFTVKVQDTIAPNNIQFVGNINDGDSFFFGDVPAQPTCTATDSGSGLDSCVVTGYKTTVGTHTLTATATDKAGNADTKTLSYTVKPYSFNGFYQPVDMSTATTTVWNTVKGGSTVPLKFELFKGATELTSTSYIIQPLLAQKVSCLTGAAGTEDAIETLATGGTSLRYDSTGGQYIYNWKTPTGAGSCYKVTVSATDGSSTITAYFKLK